MTRTLFIGWVATILFCINLNAAAQNPGDANDRDYFPGQLYVKFTGSSQVDASPLQQLKSNRQTRPILDHADIQHIDPILSSRMRQSIRKYQLQHPSSSLNHRIRSLDRIYRVHYSGDVSPELLAAKLKRRPDIEYAVPRYYRYLQETPNDPLKGKHLQFHRFYQAWDETTGSKEVIIGIIDSGVDYTHEDLLNEIWINQDEIPQNWRDSLDTDNSGTVTPREIQDFIIDRDEDLNGDGTLDLQDALASSSPLTTGADTDGNGHDDDLFGWDFWQSGLPNPDREQDNDPIGDFSDHGTHVGGLAGASTDNNTGISGTGYNARIMAVKAGGIKDIPETNPDETKIIAYGYEAMLYAATNGADIINTSWGGSAFSDFERDIIETVTDMGVLIISASGNSGNDEVIYPASFEQTLAVGSIEPDEQVANYSNYGYNLDVFATGTRIVGPIRNLPSRDTTYAQLTGTSMSSPIVSGLAALIKSKYPDWSGHRIRQQIRVTSRRIDLTENNDRRYQLGHGYIDAERALTALLPGLDIVSSDFVNNEGQKLNINEPGKLRFQIANYGETISDLNLTLISNQGNISIFDRQKQGLTVAHNDTVEFAFELQIDEDYNLERQPGFILTMDGYQGEYSDFHHFLYKDLLYDLVAANNVYTSFASNATVGFTNALQGTGGVGFQPRRKESGEFVNGPNLLFEGGLVTAFDRTVKDAVRSVDGELSQDFKPLSTFRTTQPGVLSDLDGVTQFAVRSDTADASAAQFTLHTYAFDKPAISNVVYLKYQLTNQSFDNRQLRDVYVGLFNDWDLGSIVNNTTGYIEQDSLLYAYDEAEDVPYYVGVAPMNNISGILAIDNAAQPGPEPTEFGIYDGFTDTEKYVALTSQTEKTEVGGTDISTMVASGPYHIGPRATVDIGFIYAYGKSLDELRSQIRAARSRNLFKTSSTGLHLQTEDRPEQTKIYDNYPNPFNNTTNIRVDLADQQRISADIYNILGQKVQTLTNRTYPAGIHTLRFNAANLSSGLYLVDIRTQDTRRTLKVLLVQ